MALGALGVSLVFAAPAARTRRVQERRAAQDDPRGEVGHGDQLPRVPRRTGTDTAAGRTLDVMMVTGASA